MKNELITYPISSFKLIQHVTTDGPYSFAIVEPLPKRTVEAGDGYENKSLPEQGEAGVSTL